MTIETIKENIEKIQKRFKVSYILMFSISLLFIVLPDTKFFNSITLYLLIFHFLNIIYIFYSQYQIRRNKTKLKRIRKDKFELIKSEIDEYLDSISVSFALTFNSLITNYTTKKSGSYNNVEIHMQHATDYSLQTAKSTHDIEVRHGGYNLRFFYGYHDYFDQNITFHFYLKEQEVEKIIANTDQFVANNDITSKLSYDKNIDEADAQDIINIINDIVNIRMDTLKKAGFN